MRINFHTLSITKHVLTIKNMKYHTPYRHLADNTLIFLYLVQFIKTL